MFPFLLDIEIFGQSHMLKIDMNDDKVLMCIKNMHLTCDQSVRGLSVSGSIMWYQSSWEMSLAWAMIDNVMQYERLDGTVSATVLTASITCPASAAIPKDHITSHTSPWLRP